MSRIIRARTNYQDGSALKLPQGSADPSSGIVEGDVFWRTDSAALKVCDGSSFSNIDPGLHGQVYAHTETPAASSWTITHNLGTTSVDVYVYDSSDNLLIPDTVTATDSNTVTVTFSGSVEGRAVVFGFNTGITLTVLKTPSGHDIDRLEARGYPVRSHWLMDDSVLDGTSVPDAKGNHNGTADNTIYFSGRPRVRGLAFAEDQVWVHSRIVLSGTMYTLLRDANWSFWCWAWLERATTSRPFFMVGVDGETSATNSTGNFWLNADDYGVQVFLRWEEGAGNDVIPYTTRIASGMHHLVVSVEHDTPSSGQSTARFWIDGEEVSLSSAYGTSPDGGSSGVGYLLGTPSTVVGENSPIMLSDVVLMSGDGAVPKTIDVAEQYRRGLGIY